MRQQLKTVVIFKNKNMKKTMYSVLIAFFAVSILNAQSLSQTVVSSAGATSTGASNTLSFTVGESAIGTITNGTSVDQGFWNGAIYGLTIGYDDFGFEVQPTAFPNPMTLR